MLQHAHKEAFSPTTHSDSCLLAALLTFTMGSREGLPTVVATLPLVEWIHVFWNQLISDLEHHRSLSQQVSV